LPARLDGKSLKKAVFGYWAEIEIDNGGQNLQIAAFNA
jgi:hypothetical protein